MLNIEEGNLISERFKTKIIYFYAIIIKPWDYYHLCKEASLIVSIPTSLAGIYSVWEKSNFHR